MFSALRLCQSPYVRTLATDLEQRKPDVLNATEPPRPRDVSAPSPSTEKPPAPPQRSLGHDLILMHRSSCTHGLSLVFRFRCIVSSANRASFQPRLVLLLHLHHPPPPTDLLMSLLPACRALLFLVRSGAAGHRASSTSSLRCSSIFSCISAALPHPSPSWATTGPRLSLRPVATSQRLWPSELRVCPCLQRSSYST